MIPPFAAILCLPLLASAGAGGDAPRPFRHQVTGLFAPGRERALREAFGQIPGITLVAVDFDEAEVTLVYDPAKAFPNESPEQVVQGLDNRLRSASNHTFGIKPRRTVPREKLARVEIAVAGLDCEACSLAAYELLARLEGVEIATASFRDGRVTAWIDPGKTDRARLEAALRQHEVVLAEP